MTLEQLEDRAIRAQALAFSVLPDDLDAKFTSGGVLIRSTQGTRIRFEIDATLPDGVVLDLVRAIVAGYRAGQADGR